MGRFYALVMDNAADLLFTFGAFLIVYIIARFFKASPLVAMCFGVLPPVVGYIVQNPDGPRQMMALFS